MQKIVYTGCLILFAVSFTVHCEEQFDLSLLEKKAGVGNVDASWFNAGNDLLPGEYTLKVIINDEPIGTTKITVKQYQKKVEPLFTCSQLSSWGIRVANCQNTEQPLPRYISDAKVDIDLGENTLVITVPQKFWSNSTPTDVARVQDWDNGINVAFTNYALQYENDSHTSATGSPTVYGTLENGINVGGFQLRNNGFLSWQKQGKPGYTSSTTYIRHDIDALRSTLTAGDFYTSGLNFSSLSLRGLSLNSNINMFSSTERTYVPAIVGVANTNATVVIRQNGYVIATRKVTPGPFAIKDVPASASAGDMQITVNEANGEKRTFYQSYNSSDMQVPYGVFKYNLYAGKSRSNTGNRSPLIQGDAQYGLNNTFSLLGGALYADNYNNLSAGLGANIRYLGAFYTLLNRSQGSSTAQTQTENGQKVKLGYSKTIARTHSYFFATAEHKLSPGYKEFDETTDPQNVNFKNKYSLQLSQNIGAGDAVVSYSAQENWDGSINHALRGSLNFSFSRFTLITSIGQQKNRNGISDKTLSFNVSIPLGRDMNHYLTLNHTDTAGSRTEQIAASGTLLEDRQLSYDVNAVSSRGNQELDTSLDYLSTHGLSSATLRHSQQGQQLSLGMEGAAIVHHHGVTLSQTIANGAALIHTDKIKGLKIENSQNVMTDSSGNAVVPNLEPYHYNEESLFNDTSDQNIDVSDEVMLAAPRNGAIVELDFSAHYQHKQFIRVVDPQNKSLAFGTMLYDATGKNAGIISGSGIALINTDGMAWPLHINGKDMNPQCVIENKSPKSETVWRLQCK